MSEDLEEFYQDFTKEINMGATANGDYSLDEFMSLYVKELSDAGHLEDIDICFYENPSFGIKVDGFWMNSDFGIDLYIADFKRRTKLESISKTEVETLIRRISKFYSLSAGGKFYEKLEEMHPSYGLSRSIYESRNVLTQINIYVFSDRKLVDTFKNVDSAQLIGETPVSYHIWDISRLHRLRTSKGAKEPIKVDFIELCGKGIPCLPAYLNTESYQSYLLVMPGNLVADMYSKYSSRLLEQNVRSFLQARGTVNTGIRDTIINEPTMFFAYNNGITATATSINFEPNASGEIVTEIQDLQIVNGGQTTASLFHTRRKNKASLDNVFVQMKLSIVDAEISEEVVPKISQYANTQNRVNAADFFANHPFHIQLEKFSRRIWAPNKKGALRETKWFYERARGQFSDYQSKLTPAEIKRFLAEYPKDQKFTKTDLAKFDNVWDDHPKWVNMGAQKNFVKYAQRVSSEWKADSSKFNEMYYKQAIARTIIFKSTEKIVSDAPWYKGGYRANIVAYTLAMLGHCVNTLKKSVDFQNVWKSQSVGTPLIEAISVVASCVNMIIMAPPDNISNISEWAKKDLCWTKVKENAELIISMLPPAFINELVDIHEIKAEKEDAKKTQRIDAGIEAQTKVINLGGQHWKIIVDDANKFNKLTYREQEIVKQATLIPKKIPTEKQAEVLLQINEKFQSR